jgi:hypothetical protein
VCDTFRLDIQVVSCVQGAKVETTVTGDSVSDVGREEAIRQHYGAKLADITRQLQLADSRILDMAAEVTYCCTKNCFLIEIDTFVT